MPLSISTEEMLRMLEATCENILSTDPIALTQNTNSSALARATFGHDTCAACKGTGRSPKHTNRQHDEWARADWSQYTDRNKRQPTDV